MTPSPRSCLPPGRAAGLWAAALLCGGLAACTSNVNPVFDPAPVDRAVTVGETLSFPVGARDRDGDRVRLAARGLPPGARFEAEVFRWSPLASDADGAGRPWPVTFVATDSRGGRTEARVVLTVHAGFSVPTFTSPTSAVLDLAVGPTLVLPVTVRDDDSIEVALRLVEGPEGMALVGEGKAQRLEWTPAPDRLARRRVFGATLEARDESDNVARQTVTLVVDGVLED